MAAENTLDESKRRRRKRSETETETETSTTPETEGKGRATPGRRNRPEEETEGNVITSPFLRLRNYFSDVRSELRNVVWPTRQEITYLTRIVLITLILSAILMGIVSTLMNAYVSWGLGLPIVFVVTFAIILGVTFWYFRKDGGSSRSY
jgi:preprotein translocase subunit SecE